eukprot:TRINITY_DN28549_c0_g1_i1.p1 TRINITY_DN28549_c0_g1~~TRINITY_DN28549_c0_g1_i1.p1  ORF type:complete len:149 (-),score=32.04 TRINITY_DN28549_c0_g1_i1:63-509(-)
MKVSKRTFDAFQSATGTCNGPATNFVDVKKRKTSEFPLGEAEQTINFESSSDFNTALSLFVEDSKLLEWIPKKKRKKFQSSRFQDNIFSAEDVKAILANAIEETQHKVTEEYDAAFQRKLAEQWQQFSNYNSDNINRRLQNSSHDYMS